MSQTFTNVWDALANDPAERERLKIKSRLVIDIEQRIKSLG